MTAAPDRPLVADADRPREGGADRALVEVAVGVLIRGQEFLLTTRPAGKVYPGYWEFPGGKIESGESIAEALRRELHEEIGIDAFDVRPWKTQRVDYPHALVQLHFCKVLGWRGALQMREGQQFAWVCLPVRLEPVLPGAVPVLGWLAEQFGFAGATQLIAKHQGD